jgi:hypothetical protein
MTQSPQIARVFGSGGQRRRERSHSRHAFPLRNLTICAGQASIFGPVSGVRPQDTTSCDRPYSGASKTPNQRVRSCSTETSL